jgi:hypothetical protein
MDVITVAQFLGAVVAVIVTIYGYTKYKGLKFLPADVEKKLDKLSAENAGLVSDYGALEDQIKDIVGSASIEKVRPILDKARVLGKDGYTPAELMELGRFAVETMKVK